MLDGQIVAALIAEIKTQLGFFGIDLNDLRVVRSNQATSQHNRAKDFEVFITPVTNTNIGWSRKYDHQAGELTVNHIGQRSYQISAMTRFDPERKPGVLPAQDLAQVVHDMLEHPDAIRTLRSKGVYVFECGAVRPQFWYNERDQFGALPNFDITVSFNTAYIKPVPAISGVTGDVEQV